MNPNPKSNCLLKPFCCDVKDKKISSLWNITNGGLSANLKYSNFGLKKTKSNIWEIIFLIQSVANGLIIQKIQFKKPGFTQKKKSPPSPGFHRLFNLYIQSKYHVSGLISLKFQPETSFWVYLMLIPTQTGFPNHLVVVQWGKKMSLLWLF